jgi:hypothetical protein
MIAHRGNLDGRNISWENSPDYIAKALGFGYSVEIDVWCLYGKFFLGHDTPQYTIDYEFLRQPHLWIHCKNIEAMALLSDDESLNIFAHKSGIAITTKGYLWTAPGEIITRKSIAVMPELMPDWDIENAYGICTDYPFKYI